MKVIKPGKIAVLTRNFEHGRRFYFGVSALSFIPMVPGEIMLPEVEMWKFVGKRLGADGALDVAIPKSRGEFLVNGTAYAPGGIPHPAFPTRAQVGELQKDLYVFGDRYWRGSSATDPQPITEMPLDWAHAYGGPDYARNPRGKGDAEITLEDVQIRPLPNIEAPRALIDTPRQRPEPAGYGPLDISWPQRSALAGTHDQEWLDNAFPGFARDVNWDIHNLAQRDQQREGFWSGGEAYRFDNMHPSKPTLVGHLPRFRARAFINRSHAVGQPRPSFAAAKQAAKRPPIVLEEIPLELQTLWFFPDAERAVLIWQGSTVVAEEDGADIIQLLLAAEHHDRPKPVTHYQQVIVDRLDEKYGVLAALREHELLPEDLAPAPDQQPDEDQELCLTEGFGQQNLHRRMVAETEKARAVVASYGLDPDVHGPPAPKPLAPPPQLQDLPEIIAKVEADAARQRAEIEAKQAIKVGEAEREADEAGVEGFDGEVLREEINATQVGPPTFSAAAQLASLVKIAMECRQQDMIIDEIEDMIADAALYAQWQEGEHNMREAYRVMAHYQNPAPAMLASLVAPTRERVRLALAEGEDFSTLNFTGADLTGMDLRGANMSGALLESANLTNTDLRGANLDRAVLAHALLRDTRLDDAQLVAANLGKAKLERTVLAGANLRKATLTEAHFDGADLQRACINEATLLGARFTGVDARGLCGEQLNLLDLVLERVDLSGATLSRSSFLNGDLRGGCFDGAALESCTFLSCRAEGASFIGANLTNARFVDGCSFDGAVLSSATLTRANLRGTSLVGADLRKAVLDDADLCECDLSEAKLYQAVARGARFEVSDLRNAELMSANLMGASFARASIYGADFRGANLHGADMARVRTDANVRLDQALLTKVRIHPRHVDAEEPSPS